MSDILSLILDTIKIPIVALIGILGILLPISPSSKKLANAVQELRRFRETSSRDSERVIKIWNSIVFKNKSNLGNEKWAILEQVFIAALDVSNHELANSCLAEFQTAFKQSQRVQRLSGIHLEKLGRYDDARKIYNDLIEDDPTDTLARKRLIAILKAQRKPVQAIDELKSYLKLFMLDHEAWHELADLYLSELDYKHASFCLEELMLASPHNHLLCQRYAEIKYTEGGVENWELALAYFTFACQLNPNNLRAVIGVILSCSALDHNLAKSLSLPPQETDPSLLLTNQSKFSLPLTDDSDALPAGAGGLRTLVNGHSGKRTLEQLARWASGRLRVIYGRTGNCQMLANRLGKEGNGSRRTLPNGPCTNQPSKNVK